MKIIPVTKPPPPIVTLFHAYGDSATADMGAEPEAGVVDGAIGTDVDGLGGGVKQLISIAIVVAKTATENILREPDPAIFWGFRGFCLELGGNLYAKNATAFFMARLTIAGRNYD